MAENDNLPNDEQQQNESKKKKQDQPLPYLLELSLTIWQLVVVASGAAAAFLSWMNGAGLIVIALRSGVTMLCLGLLAAVVNRALNQGLLEVYQPGPKPNERQ